MNKKVRCLLGSLSTAALILSSSLPLMGADAEPQLEKDKPAVKDVEREMKCGASMKKPAVQDKEIESKCAGMKKKPAVDDNKGELKCGAEVIKRP